MTTSSISQTTTPDSFPANWDNDFQRSVLATLFNDDRAVKQAIAWKCQPGYFTDSTHATLAAVLFNYVRRYKSLPSLTAIKHEITLLKSDAKQQAVIAAELNTVVKYCDRLDPAYLRDTLFPFIKASGIKAVTMSTFVDLARYGINEPEAFDRVDASVRENILGVQLDQDDNEGLDYAGSVTARYSRLKQELDNKERFGTGFNTIDTSINGGGLARGEIGSIVGASGSGKSLFLQAIAAFHAVVVGSRVLYISLELRQDKVAMRLDSMITKVPYRLLLEQAEQVEATLAGIKLADRLRIKEFPAGSADIGQIEQYLDDLRPMMKPDIVIVDYVGEMRHPPEVPLYQSRVQIVRELRAMASRYDCAVFTAMQCNRQGKANMEDSVIDEQHFGQSYEQLQPLDACWSLNQSKVERINKLFRLHCIKHRDGIAFERCYARMDADTLAMSEVIEPDYRNILSKSPILL